MEHTTLLAAVLFLICAVISGAVIQWAVSKVKAYKPPVSILWFVFGMILCMIELWVVPKKDGHSVTGLQASAIDVDPNKPLGLMGIGIAEAARVNNSLLYHIILPILLYDATQQISWYHFRKSLRVGLLLAILGVILQVVVIGFLMQWSFTQVSNVNSGTVSRRLFEDTGGPNSYGPNSYGLNSHGPNSYGPNSYGLSDNVSLTWNSNMPTMWDGQSSLPQITAIKNATWIKQDNLSQEFTPAPTPMLRGSAENSIEVLPSEFDRMLFNSPTREVSTTEDKIKPIPVLQRFLQAKSEDKPSLAFSMMTAAAVASTDPIAVISILEEMEAPHHFSSLFDCESLINDGSSIFLFSFFKSIMNGKSATWGESIQRFATLLFVGPIFGFVVACIMYRWLRHFHFHPYDETLAVIFVSYLVFYIAEIYLHTSGPLTIVVYGLYFKAYAKAAFETATMDVHAHLVRGMATAATSVVFIVSGIASVRMMWDAYTAKVNLELPDDFPAMTLEGMSSSLEGNPMPTMYSTTATQLWRVPVFYLFLIIARFLMVGLFYPIIRRTMGGFSWKEYLLLSWGGLRGAVCLILALIIEQDKDMNPSLSSTAALYIASSAFLILLLNGISFEFMFKLLQPYTANPFKQVYLKRVMKNLDREYFNEVGILQQHWLFKDSWALVYADRLVPRLGKIEMDVRGRIHMDLPKVSKAMRQLELIELNRCKIVPTKTSPTKSLVLSPPEAVIERRESSRPSKGDIQADGPGRTAAALVQKLRRAPDQPIDLERNLELLHMEEIEEPEPDVISRQMSSYRDDGNAEFSPPASIPVEITSSDRRKASDVSEDTHSASAGHRVSFRIPTKDLSAVMRGRKWSPDEPNLAADPSIDPQPGLPARDHAATSSSFRTVDWKPLSPERPQDENTILRSEVLPKTHNVDLTPFKRIPGYRNDFIARIRSEPYGGMFDAAHLERLDHSQLAPRNEGTPNSKILSLGDSSPMGEANPSQNAFPHIGIMDWDANLIPRTMSVPNQIATRMRYEEQQDHLTSSFDAQQQVKQRDQEGEIVIMVLNTMRQLYKRMLDQAFISGTTYVGLMAVADVVSDFAILDVAKQSNVKAWKDIFDLNNDGYYRASGQDIEELEDKSVAEESNRRCSGWRFWSFRQRSRRAKMERVSHIMGSITGFDVEWRLVESRIRGFSQTHWELAQRLFKSLTCQRAPLERRPRLAPERKSVASSQNQSTLRRWNRKVWTTMWSWLGPRQIFPALDDLQLLCAYVDVHDEMLMRGNRGLRMVLGTRMLSAFETQIERARETVYRLEKVYPDTFSYAMVCHGALFLVNLKIQLVEEFFEKGLLLSEDKDKICEGLKEQLITITKYHPPFLFT